MVGRGLFLGVFFIAYAIQAITGFAGNIIAMPAGMATVGMQESVAMLNATGMIGCGLIAIQNWKHINWRELAIMLAVMTPFMFVGIWLDTVLPLGILSKIYGAIVVVVGRARLSAQAVAVHAEVAARCAAGARRPHSRHVRFGRRHSRDLRAPAPSGQRPVPRYAFVHLDGAQFRVCRAAA